MGSQKFRTYLLWGQFSAVLLPLLLVAMFTYFSLGRTLQEEASQKNLALIKSMAERIEDFIRIPSIFFTTIRSEDLKNSDPHHLEVHIQSLIKAFPYLEEVEILDNQGRITHAIPPNPGILGINKADLSYVKQTLGREKMAFSSSQIDMDTETVSVSMAYGSLQYLILARLNLEYLGQLILEFSRGMSPGFDLIVTDSKGVYLASTAMEKVLQREKFLPFRTMLLNQVGDEIVGQDETSGNIITGIPIKSAQWYLFLLQPVNEILAPLFNFYFTFGLVVLGALGLILLLTLYWTRTFDRSLARLLESYKQVSSGRLDDINSEFTLREFKSIQESFVAMVDKLKYREAENRLQLEELGVKNAEHERFTYTIIHDLKSPLITIKGFLGHLKQDWLNQNSDRFDQDLQRVGNAADKMNGLLEDLLQLSQAAYSRENTNNFFMHTAFKTALENLKIPLSPEEIIYFPEPWPEVRGDIGRFIEVWQHLLENSLKFRTENQSLKLEAGWETHGDEIHFFLKDNGVGVSPLYHKKIFGLFEKLNPALEGSGIGLALVTRILEAHQGRVWVESLGNGKGSTFFFSLKNTSTL